MRGDLFQAPLTLQRCVWNDKAERELNGAFAEIPAHEVAQMVDAGTCELWQVNGDSWLITGIEKDENGRYLFVWSYAGRNARSVADALRRIAKRNGMTRIQFVTFHRGLGRLLSNVSPRVVCVTDKGARLYEFEVLA